MKDHIPLYNSLQASQMINKIYIVVYELCIIIYKFYIVVHKFYSYL